MIHYLREGALSYPSSIYERLNAARTWRVFSRKYKHVSELEAMTETLNLVDEALAHARSLENLHQHLTENEVVQEAQAVASDAAAFAINLGNVQLGVMMLERGRAMIFTQLGHLRHDLNAIEETAPELYLRFTELSNMLNDLVVHGEQANTIQNTMGSTYEDPGAM